MDFDVVGEITDIEAIATGSGIRILSVLRKRYGRGRWRKLKGLAKVPLGDGAVRQAEIHGLKRAVLVREKCGSSDFWIKTYGNQTQSKKTIGGVHSYGRR